MKRPLPMLEAHRPALETCGYCPKLCRSTCPVSNVEAREALIPWAKMSQAWFSARGDLENDKDSAATAWGCSGCHACTEFCEHDNPVADTLYAARAAARRDERQPLAVQESEARHELRGAEAEAARRPLTKEPGVRMDAPVALLVGCAYLRKERGEAGALVRSLAALAGSVRLVSGCCGVPSLHSGDREGYARARQRLADATRGVRSFVVGDAGCALALRDLGAEPFVRYAAERAGRLGRVDGMADSEALRIHDSCALGRGMQEYDAPRRLLERALGRPADEFSARGAQAECSGGGGLLPISMPETSRAIAALRLAEHARLGGGRIVATCSGSLRRFRASGGRVIGIAQIVEQSLGLPRD